MSDIMEVPLPLAASSRLISFLTFHISIFFSACREIPSQPCRFECRGLEEFSPRLPERRSL